MSMTRRRQQARPRGMNNPHKMKPIEQHISEASKKGQVPDAIDELQRNGASGVDIMEALESLTR